jgi:hypothetical protein
MTNAEKTKRIIQAINETESLLDKAKVKNNNSLRYLEMEIKENKEFGNSDEANNHAREYVQECQDRVKWLENHIIKLNNMMP